MCQPKPWKAKVHPLERDEPSYDELFEMYRTERKFYLKRKSGKLLPFLDREKDV